MAAAEEMARQRASEALDRILSGEALPRRERRTGYGGAFGLPIREEVLERHGPDVITRNSYGAQCLNTPHLLIADVDFTDGASWTLIIATFGVLMVLAIAAANHFDSTAAFLSGLLAAVMLAYPLALRLRAAAVRFTGGNEAHARRRVEAAMKSRPGWGARLYRTPAGMRVIVPHAAFDPRSPEVQKLFEDLRVDPVYALMCRNQNCFRARLTAKPWRIGIGRHVKPRSGTWPVAPEKMAERQEWVARYEPHAAEYSACRYLVTVGSSYVAQKLVGTLRLHDERAGARAGKPLA